MKLLGEEKMMKEKSFINFSTENEKEMECIYTRWIALKLVKKGYKIVKWGINEYHPQFETYYFEKTPVFLEDFRRIVKEGRFKED